MNPLRLLPREQCTKLNRFRNINLMSIAYALRLGLGPTNPEMITMAQETFALNAERILTSLTGYSFQHSHIPTAPPNLPIRLHC